VTPGTKLCRGPSHTEPVHVPLDRFPRRSDRPSGHASRCADCTNWEKLKHHHGNGGHGYEYVSRYRWIFDELNNRLGHNETARRIGLSRSGLLLLRTRNLRVRRITLRRAIVALRQARAHDEVYSRASIHYGLNRPGYQPTRPRHERDYVNTRSDHENELRQLLRQGGPR
jgi:hypothetical protein